MARESETEQDAVGLGGLTDLAGYHLRRASNAFGSDFARALAGTGMRQVTLGILSVIAANPGVNQGSVGKVLGIQRANMVALINELVDAGLIDRQTSKADRRAFELSVTAQGKAKLAESMKHIAAHEERMLAGLSGADRAMLIDLLGRIEALEG